MLKNHCPCGSKKSVKKCCIRFIEGGEFPDSPEELMRSRYTAYTLKNIDYIKDTMKDKSLREFDLEQSKSWAEQATWKKCDILQSSQDGDNGMVEFKVYYDLGEQEHILHEKSLFKRYGKQWYYVDGRLYNTKEAATKIARNDPCPCGSGKKHKKCCL